MNDYLKDLMVSLYFGITFQILFALKRLLIINAVTLTVVFIAAVAPNYYVNYQMYVSLTDSLTRHEWLIFLGILAGSALLSAFFAFIELKNISYTCRALGINVFFNMAFLLAISYQSILAIIAAKRDYEVLMSEYKTKAESDMKNGLIVYETVGLPVSSGSAEQVKEDKVDSLMKTYGIESRNIGCLITAPLLKAQSEYEQLTAPYLDRRNGSGWKHRMDLQIERLRKDQF